MRFAIYETATGRVTGYKDLRSEAEAALNTFPGRALVRGEADLETDYVDLSGEPTIAPRPSLGLPATHALGVGADWAVPNVPVGTVVRIDGEDMGTVDADGLTLSFAAAGTWPVELQPPFPWLEASCEVTVT